jgi:hypothetical protein
MKIDTVVNNFVNVVKLYGQKDNFPESIGK